MSCEAVQSTNIYSLSELHVCIDRSILLARGLVLVFIYLSLYLAFICLKHVFLSKESWDGGRDTSIMAHHDFSTHKSLVEVGQRFFMRTHLLIDIEEPFHDGVNLV